VIAFPVLAAPLTDGGSVLAKRRQIQSPADAGSLVAAASLRRNQLGAIASSGACNAADNAGTGSTARTIARQLGACMQTTPSTSMSS